MAHFLAACVTANEPLFPLSNTIHSRNLKPEERVNAETLYTLKILVDVEKQFYIKYFCQVDKENHLANTTYYQAQSTADRILTIDTLNANTFNDSMKLDQIGDVSVDETVQGQTSLCIYQTHTNKIETKQIKKNLKLNCVKLRLNWQKT